MAQNYKTGLIITGDASGGIRAIKATDDELAKLNQGFDRGSRRSQQFNRNVNATSQGLTVLRRAAAPIAGAIAGMFAANTLQNQINWGDQLQKTNLRIGASTEALSQYNYVASLSGVEFGQLTTAWQRQTRRIAEAAQGTGVAVAALDRLNLSAQELNQLAPEEQFERIAAAMQGVENSSERVRLAQQLWDSEGVKLIQIVNSGTDAISAMRAEADALGLTISQETANAMATYNDEEAILSQLVPTLTEGLQRTNEWVNELGGAEVIVGHLTDGATVLAALMAGRYAGAMATATASKVAAIRQAVLYQGALARMAGVSRTAAAGQIALAGATRTATSAMALVGGPAGAAVLAGLAIYSFREELGLVQPEIEASADRVAELTGRIDDMSRAVVENRISDLTADLEQLKTSFIEVTEIGSAADTQRISGSGVLGVAPGETGRQGRAIQRAENGVVEGIHSPETLAEIKAHEEALENLQNRFEALGSASITIPPIVHDNEDASKAAAKAAEEAAREYEKFQTSVQTLQDKLFPLEAAQRQYREEQELIVLALARGEIGIVRYLESMERLETSTRSAKNVSDAYGVSAQQSASQVNQAAQDLGFAFESAFESATIQGEGLRSVLGGIAEDIARITLRQTVTAPIGNWVSGAVGGLFGGSGESIAGGFLSQIGGYADGGYTGAGGRLEPAGVVHRGEFVVQKRVVEQPGVRPMLEALNQGVAAQFANGGYVVPALPPALPSLGIGRGYADGGYVNAPGPANLEQFNQTHNNSSQSVSLSVSVPVTVQAAPGMNQEQAQQQGQAIGKSVEGAVVRVLQRELRHGGILHKR